MKEYTGRQIRCGIGTDDQKWYSEEEYNELKTKLAKAEATIKAWQDLEHERNIEQDINLFDNEELETQDYSCDGGCGRIWSDEDPYDIFVPEEHPDEKIM